VLQIVAQLLVFPVGRLWVRLLPNVRIFGCELNPGPFTIKEHVRTILELAGQWLIALTGACHHYGHGWCAVSLCDRRDSSATRLLRRGMGLCMCVLLAPPPMVLLTVTPQTNGCSSCPHSSLASLSAGLPDGSLSLLLP
jgi:OPT oligopeptide transporter protein